MKTANELLALRGVIDPATGLLWALDRDGAWTQVTFPNGVNPDFKHVLNASLLMHQTLNNIGEGLGKIVTVFEAFGIEEAVSGVLSLQAAASVAVRCANEGLDNIANSRK